MDKYHILILLMFTIVHISIATASTDLSVCDIHRVGDDLSVSVLNNGSNTTARLTVYAVAENDALVESLHPYPAEGVHHCNETWNITHPGAVRMRIHFSEIEVYGGVGGRDRLIVEDGCGGFVCGYMPVKIPSEQYKPYRASEVHTPWITGDMARVVLNITGNRTYGFRTFGFRIDEYNVYESGVPIYDGDIDFGDYELKSITFPTDRDYIVAIIDEENNINETNETNNELTRKLAPEITGITFDPAVPMVGDTVTISARVRNPGTDATTGVLLWIGDVVVANTTLSIAHNLVETVVFHWTAAEDGCYNMTIVTDDDEMTAGICVYHDDLSVTDLVVNPVDPVLGDSVSIEASGIGDILVYDWGSVPCHLTFPASYSSAASPAWVVRHPGAEWIRLHFSYVLLDRFHISIYDANKTLLRRSDNIHYDIENGGDGVDIWTEKFYSDTLYICMNLDEFYTPSDLPTDFTNLTIDRYEYRVNETLPADWNAYPVGPHNITAVVDEGNNTLELDETNNRMSREIVVRGCDLSITDVTTEGELVDGGAIEIHATVENPGVLQVTSDISFFVDTEHIDLAGITLAAGESKTLTAVWTAVANTHTICVVADLNNSVAETDESNNELMIVVEVVGADFSVPAITASPETISATIRNTGSASDVGIGIYDCTLLKTYNSSGLEQGGQTVDANRTGADCICVNISYPENTDIEVKVSGSAGTVTVSEPGWVVMPGDTITLEGVVGGDRQVYAEFYAGPIITSFDGETIGRNESLDISADWTPAAGRHAAVVYADPGQVVCETDEENNFWVSYIYIDPTVDFAVTTPRISPEYLVDGDFADITVLLNGIADGSLQFTLEDHLTRNLTEIWYGESLTITHESDAIRVHFEELVTSAISYLVITDADDHVLFTHTYDDDPLPGNWSPWIREKTIHIVKVGDYPIVADIDRYECKNILRDMTVPVVANVTDEITATWQASTGSHTIHAEIASGIEEINATNNCADKLVSVKPSRDPAVLNITYNPPDPENGDSVSINAEIANIGFRHADTAVEIWDVSERNLTIKVDNFFKGYTRSWRIPGSRTRTGVGAEMTGVHFESIDTTISGDHSLYVYDASGAEIADYSYCKHEDLWVWGRGDFLTVSFRCKWGGMPEGFLIDGYAHKKLLNKTTVSLGSDETAYMNATMNATTGWHTIEAVIDPEDRIDEINESNNMLCKSVWVKGPDLTPVNIRSEGGKISAMIRNSGDGGAENVTVSFCREVNYSYSRTRFCGLETERIKHRDATKIRVRFKDMKIYGNLYIKDEDEVIVDEYSGKASDIWTEWVHGDRVKIVANARCGAGVPLSSFEIDRYEYEFEDEIIDLDAGKQIPVTGDAPCEYEEPYNLSVWVDVDDTILESDEDNNNKKVMVGADISLKRHAIPGYLVVDHPLNFIVQVENKGMLSLPKFNVTLYDMTDDEEIVPVENHTIEMLESLDECYVKFEWEPPAEGGYGFIIRADPEDKIVELDEKNNEIYCYARAFKNFGYEGSYLKTYADGEVNGSFIFEMGDRVGDSEQWYEGTFEEGDIYEAEWNILLPADASIKIARLYLYWGFTAGYTKPTEFNVKFNDHLLAQYPGYPDYSDYPIEEGVAYGVNYAYGVYGYNVKDYVTGNDKSIVTIRDLHEAASTCIAGMSLVIIYESDEGILTKYWINEGADVLGCGGADRHFSPLLPDECITEVVFEGSADSDGLSNATLITVVPWGNHGDEKVDEEFYRGTKWAGKKKNGLYFNGKELKDGAYICNADVDSVGIDERDVKDDLVKRNNVAEIQDRGDGMMVSANGFLILRYPPDLVVINLTAPESTVVGAQHSINTTIRNDGRSDAHDFNVTFYIDGKQMVRIPHLDLPAGENVTLHLYNWTPMLLMHVYNLTAAADVLSGEEWTEVETDNNAMSKSVIIEEGGFGNQTGPRGTGGGSNPTGGEFTEKITGRVMQGMKEFLSMGGGGGAGMFSLTEWIMKGAVWLVLLLFVGLGYRMEGRSYGKASWG